MRQLNKSLHKLDTHIHPVHTNTHTHTHTHTPCWPSRPATGLGDDGPAAQKLAAGPPLGLGCRTRGAGRTQ